MKTAATFSVPTGGPAPGSPVVARAVGAVPAALPDHEDARLAALERHMLLDSDSEESFDDLVALASEVCGTPIALVSLVDRDRQWFKARVGLDATETPRELAFCAHAILEPREVFTVTDATRDARFAGNPLVTGDPHIRFYAGSPIVDDEGHALGTVCVIDTRPRTLTPAQERSLKALSRQAAFVIRLRQISLDAARIALEQASLTIDARFKQERGSELLDLVLQGRGLGLWDLDVASGRWTANAREHELLGYPFDEGSIGLLDWKALVHPDDLKAVFDSMQPHLRGEAPYYECTPRMKHRHGHWVWMLSRAVVVERDAAGVPLRIVGTHMDVSERRRVDDERRQNAERLELAMAGGSLGLWDLHIATRTMVCNEQWASMLGHPLPDAGRAVELWNEVVHPDDRDAFFVALDAHLTGRTPRLECESRMRHRDGHWIWVMTRARISERDAAGNPVRVVGININITTRKSAEAALADEVNRRRVLFDEAGDSIFVLDRRMHLTNANHAFAATLGYSYDELMRLRPWEWGRGLRHARSIPCAMARDQRGALDRRGPVAPQGRVDPRRRNGLLGGGHRR